MIPATLGSAARGQPCPCDEGSFLASHRWIAHPLAPPTPHVCPVCSPILVWTAQPALATLPLPTEFHVCLFENPALNTHPGGFLRQGAGPGRSGGSGSEPKAVGLGGFPCAVCRLICSKHVTTQYCAKCVSKEAAPSAGLTCPRSPAVRVLGCALWVQVGSQEGTWLVPYAAPYLPPRVTHNRAGRGEKSHGSHVVPSTGSGSATKTPQASSCVSCWGWPCCPGDNMPSPGPR